MNYIFEVWRLLSARPMDIFFTMLVFSGIDDERCASFPFLRIIDQIVINVIVPFCTVRLNIAVNLTQPWLFI